jgi:hypothetical protein
LRHGHKRFIACVRLSELTGKGNVINYADYFVIVLLSTSTTDSFSNRILVGPEGARRSFIDDDDIRVIGRIS